MNIKELCEDVFPLLRGRTGVEAITRDVPMVVRMYSGSLRVISYRTKMKCSIRGNSVLIGTKPVDVPYEGSSELTVNKATLAFDYPFLERIEAALPCFPEIELAYSVTITLLPSEKCLLTMSSDSENES